MSRRLVTMAALLGVASGCSLLSLDVLQGEGAGGTGGGSDASTPASSGDATSGAPTSSVSGNPSSTSGTSASSGGGGETSSSGAGGDTSSSEATTTGGIVCPDDPCVGSTDTFCETFDDVTDLTAWEQLRGYEEASTFELVDDPHVTCPNAAKVYFSGPSGNEGGWAELFKSVPGQPTSVSLDTRVWRDSASPGDAEGVLEITWQSDGKTCILQVYVSDNPAAQAFINEYDDFGGGVALPPIYLTLPDGVATHDGWLDLGVDIELGGSSVVTLRSGAAFETVDLDPEDVAECDDGPPLSGTWRVAIGAPYNTRPITLYYDDYRVVAE